MNTQTNTNTPANQPEEKDNKKSMAAKVATGVAATAAAAGIGSVVASLAGDTDGDEAQVEQEQPAAQADASTFQAEQEFSQMMANNEPQANAPQSPAATQAAQAQPQASQPQPAQAAQQPAELAADEIHSDIPVDEAWLSTPPAQQSDNATQQAQAAPAAQAVQANNLGYDPNDPDINTVNVSPEVLMAMLHMRPTHMIQTEFRGDGLDHTAALLADENGENYMLVDTDGDGLLDKLTDMDGNSYASLDENIQFVVDSNAMTNFIDTTNPNDGSDELLYAHIEEAEIVNIEGDGEGEDMAYIDDNDIATDDTIDDTTDEIDNIEEDAADEDLAYESETDDDLTASDAADAEINTDLLSYDDSSLA